MRYLLYLLALLMIVSCTEDITITTDNQEPKLIIFGFITTDTTAHTIQLSRSVPYFGSYNPEQTIVSGAEVYINDMPLTENQKRKGFFHTDSSFFGVAGETYQLKVLVDFNSDGTQEMYTAQATMPPISKMDSITFFYGSLFAKNPPKDRPSITPVYYFKPIPNSLYGGDFYYDSIKYTHNISNYELGILGTSAINQDYISYPLLGFRTGDYFIISRKDTVHSKPLATVKFTLNNMTSELYTFYSSAQIEMTPSIPLFGGQPANVEGNISNGALGCFGAYAVSKVTAKLPFTLYSLNGSWTVKDTINPALLNTTIIVKNGKGLIPKPGTKDSILYLKNFELLTDKPKFAADILQLDGSYKRDSFLMEHYSKMIGKNGTVWTYKQR